MITKIEITHPSIYRPAYCPGSESTPVTVEKNHHRCVYCRIWFSNSAGFRVVRQHELHFWPGENVAVMLNGNVHQVGIIQSRISEFEYSVLVENYPSYLETFNVQQLKPTAQK